MTKIANYEPRATADVFEMREVISAQFIRDLGSISSHCSADNYISYQEKAAEIRDALRDALRTERKLNRAVDILLAFKII